MHKSKYYNYSVKFFPQAYASYLQALFEPPSPPPGGKENPTRHSEQPLEHLISAAPQFIPRQRTLSAGDMPHTGHFRKSVISHPLQQMFVAAQLANGPLQTLQVCQLRFRAADFSRDITR